MNYKLGYDKYIQFYYLSGPLEADDVEEVKTILNKVGLDVHEFDRNGVIVHCADDFSNIVSLVINTPLLINILKDIGPNALWDAIKLSSIFAWNKARGKYYTKITSGNQTEQKPITIGIIVNIEATNYNFRFDGLSTEQELSIALDKTFDFLREESKKQRVFTTYLAKYNTKKENWEIKDLLREIRDKLNKEKN